MQMFGRQAVIGADHRQACGRPNISADVIMAFQPADHKPATVQIDDRRLRTGKNAAHHTRNRAVLRRNPVGIAAMERAAHCVIDRALLSYRQGCGIGGIRVFAGLDKGPRLRVDQPIIIHAHSLLTAVLQMPKQKQWARTDPARALFQNPLGLSPA